MVTSRLEAVAHARLGDQIARLGRIRFQLRTQLRDIYAQIVRLRLVAGTPHLLQQLPLADELAGMPYEHLEKMPFGRREADVRAVAGHPSRAEIDTERIGDG